jgi:hypothetical protein
MKDFFVSCVGLGRYAMDNVSCVNDRSAKIEFLTGVVTVAT